jgi:hypothetical protein
MAGVGLVTVSLRKSTGGKAFDFSGIVKTSGSDQMIAKPLLRLPIPFLRKDHSMNFGRLAVTTSWSRILAGCSARTSLVIGRCVDQGFALRAPLSADLP